MPEVQLPVPNGSCDCHTHIFPSAEQFPPELTSSYPLPEAPVELHRSVAKAAGLARGVLVQPAPYAQNPSGLIDALQRFNGELRAVASARSEITDHELEAMDAAGVRGLRFVEARTPAGDRFPGAVELAELELLAPRMKAMGWHAEVWAPLDTLLEAWPRISGLGVPIVTDHMGGFDVTQGVQGASFQRLVGLLRNEGLWVKLTLCRRVAFGSDYSELRPFHDALLAADPAGLLWGSDWPFVRMGENAPTVERMLGLFNAWVDDDALRRRILVENPTFRYGFDAVT